MSHSTYRDALAPRETHQQRPMPGREAEMVPNSEGGFVFPVGDWQRLRRFLVLGTEGGSFYASSKDLTADNAEAVVRCLSQDGPRAVAEIVAVSEEGRAPKNDQAIFALAVATVPEYADEATRRLAFYAIPRVCRTGTHLYQFCDFVDGLRGWGQGLMAGVGRWFTGKDADDLAYQAVKYRQRAGWTGRDVLRSAHPHPRHFQSGSSKVAQWMLGKGVSLGEGESLPNAIVAYEAAQDASSPREIVEIIGEYGRALPHEAIPTELKANGEVWQALLEQGMPMTAMIRNLANMTRYGVLAPNSSGERIVREALADEEALAKARIHPVKVLSAMKVYANGGAPLLYSYRQDARGGQGATWTPNQRVVDALDAAFYASFRHVEPANKRFVFGLDVSGSMGHPFGDSPLTCMEAAVAMAMVGEAAEPYSACMGFDHGLVDLRVTHRDRLDHTLQRIPRNWGGTRCELPVLWALENGVEADAFVVITDNETHHGSMHPAQAIQKYRRQTGIPAKLAVIGMVANDFSIADPNDPGMLDFVGFDTSTPAVVSDFAAGRV